MINEDYYIESIKAGVAVKAKNDLLQVADYLTDKEVCELVNKLVTFENSYIIARCFKDEKVRYALYEELGAYNKELYS